MIIFTMLGSIIGGGDTLNKRRDYITEAWK